MALLAAPDDASTLSSGMSGGRQAGWGTWGVLGDLGGGDSGEQEARSEGGTVGGSVGPGSWWARRRGWGDGGNDPTPPGRIVSLGGAF